MPIKLIVAGGRNFNDPQRMHRALCELIHQGKIPAQPELVCGMARGADLLGRYLWTHYGLPVHEFPADWRTHGKKAGHMRNKQMAEFGDVLLAFWDGESAGTRNMISTMESIGKPVFMERY